MTREDVQRVLDSLRDAIGDQVCVEGQGFDDEREAERYVDRRNRQSEDDYFMLRTGGRWYLCRAA